MIMIGKNRIIKEETYNNIKNFPNEWDEYRKKTDDERKTYPRRHSENKISI